VEEVGEDEPGGSGSDDTDLGTKIPVSVSRHGIARRWAR
jgi:hypothetical protein